ncbi:PaaI family thioesterase [Shewanella sp. D64]|uniref:PaaI family thioesterase n=1 Tax=unclassified Shewanella TaxID=196818 RepID=UPI0022BA27A2|nr:PaaI family thioesterase [Shewanella sp. MTB7]MEC4725771.1 PaaI family thioesterase [Shewanella sp. D64]MEC4737622.1 PaaI family thioesterase [Shewanella sp. E94]WBJ93435.1 PaaI family thioesterase [Shewanella sp. MTB7]
MKVSPEFFPLTQIATRFVDQLAQCRRLNLRVHEASEHHVLVELPYSHELIGYPDTGVIHGGVITTLMDTASGSAVVCSIFEKYQVLEISPTLDLRVDYMKPADPNKPVYGFAECYKISSSVAFTRCIAYQDSIDDPIAHAVGSFMRISPEMIGDEFPQILLGKGPSTQLEQSDGGDAGKNALKQVISTSSQIDVKEIVKKATELNDFSHLLAHVPYANFIGMAVECFGDELVFKLPAKDDNIGNPILPAIHGGVIAGFMEMSAIVQLMVFMHTTKVPKVVDFSIDYLRAGYHKDSFAECKITRQGRRVANVSINCWQMNRKKLIATARAHFLID